MAMTVETGLALPSEREAVLELLTGQYVEHGIPAVRERMAHAVDGVFSDTRRGALLLARLDGVPVGLAGLSFLWSYEHGGLCCWLEELYVRPEHRDRGIGGQLLRAAVEHARQSGCTAVDLEVEESQDRAAHLYERFGFRAHTRRRYVLPLHPSIPR
jgi:GNAT superfamily N-acetyltransferase